MNTENEKLIRDIASALDAFSLKIFALHQNGSMVSRIEADLLKEKLRLIYDKVDQLENGRSSNLSAALAESVIMNPLESSDTPVVALHAEPDENAGKIHETKNPQQEESVFMKVDEVTETPEAEAHIQESIQPEVLLTEVETPDINKETARQVTAVQADETIGSRYNPAETLSDRIARGHHDQRLSEQLKKSPLQDLRRSTGLNERFAFIRGLFNGDQQAFYECIDKLNGMHDYVEAHQYFENEAEKMKWNRNSELVIELEELVKRRFGV